MQFSSSSLLCCLCLVLLFGLVAAASVKIAEQKGRANPHQIFKLPGYEGPEITFNQYAGYLEINSTGRNLFYWFVESQNNPQQDPLVLWLNGGPGCSSMTGFLTEHGPFQVVFGGQKLTSNPYSWNKVANIIYLDSPIGAGYSYAKNTSDYLTYNDDKTAEDTYAALLKFFEMYPQFQKHDFYITGESYGGHYVPILTNLIHENNKAQQFKMNLKGFLVGNGLLDKFEDGNSLPTFMWQHALISNDYYNKALKACQGDFVNNVEKIPECGQYVGQLFYIIWGVNFQNIYMDCKDSANKNAHEYSTFWGKRKMDTQFTHKLFTIGTRGLGKGPCIDTGSPEKYLNNPDVKNTLLHDAQAAATVQWKYCNSTISKNYAWTYDSMIPFYKKLVVENKYRAMFYSGDVDVAVNVMGSQLAVEKMNMTVTKEWSSWKYNDQISGFKVLYDNFTFLTVKGGGHMVPQDKPEWSLYFFTQFLNNKDV